MCEILIGDQIKIAGIELWGKEIHNMETTIIRSRIDYIIF